MTRPIVAAALILAFALPTAAQEPNFGRAVALSGADLVIGQPVNWYGPGMVYTYRSGAADRWEASATLTAPDSSRMDDFGRALALDGNTLVVGAPRKRDGAGVVYVYERSEDGGAWGLADTLEPPAGVEPGEYGAALALAGDELLVGAPAAGSTGAVHLYRREGDGWGLDRVIGPPVGEPGVAGFGLALSRLGDRLLVGAPASDEGQGRAYLTEREADGAWGAPRRLILPEGMPERAGAGTSVLLTNDRALVGAPGASAVLIVPSGDDADASDVGLLRPYDAPARARFGEAMSRVGDREIWVGAPGSDGGNGSVYRFLPDGEGGWQGAYRLDPDVTDGASWPLGFGYAIAADGPRAVVAMPSRDFGEGRVMALSRSGTRWRAGELLEGRIYRIGAGLTTGDRCEDGRMGEFPCSNMQMVAHLPISELGGERGVWVNDVWGWEDPDTGRRYALVARRDGAAFVDVTEPAAPFLVGNLPRTRGSRPSVWRDIKVIGTTAYIVADGAGQHGMQVFDLTRLRSVDQASAEFEPDTTYHEIASAHNVVADTASGFLYVVGSNSGGQTCGGGLHMVDARDPLRPAFAGCYHDAGSAGSRGYTHDAQCLVYDGPDQDYRGRQICVGSNESELNIADVTDKANPVTVARTGYPNVAYAHQGWFDDERRYFYMNDEGDELVGTVAGTRTLVWDLTDLDDPVLVNEYIGPVRASDHNLFVVGDRVYESNYGSGLRVLDISDRENPREIAFFDSAPYNDDAPGHSAGQSGAWSNYPFFEDGLVIFTSVREGLFIMRVSPRPVS